MKSDKCKLCIQVRTIVSPCDVAAVAWRQIRAAGIKLKRRAGKVTRENLPELMNKWYERATECKLDLFAFVTDDFEVFRYNSRSKTLNDYAKIVSHSLCTHC